MKERGKGKISNCPIFAPKGYANFVSVANAKTRKYNLHKFEQKQFDLLFVVFFHSCLYFSVRSDVSDSVDLDYCDFSMLSSDMCSLRTPID